MYHRRNWASSWLPTRIHGTCHPLETSNCYTVFTRAYHLPQCQVNSVHFITPFLCHTHFSIIFPYIPRYPSWSLSFTSSNKNFVQFCCMCTDAMTSIYVISRQPNFFRLIIFGKEYMLWTSHVGQCNSVDVHDLVSYHNE